MNKDGARHAAATNGKRRILNRHVIVHDHMVNVKSVFLSRLLGHLKVHGIARVVLDDQQDTLVAGSHRSNPGGNPVHCRRSKYRAAHRGIEHAGAHKSQMCRLMAHAATGNKSNLVALGMRAHDDIVRRLCDKRRICLHVTIDHLALDISRIVDELFHSKSSRKKIPRWPEASAGFDWGTT